MNDHGEVEVLPPISLEEAQELVVATTASVERQSSGESYLVVDELNGGEPMCAFVDEKDAKTFVTACAISLELARKNVDRQRADDFPIVAW